MAASSPGPSPRAPGGSPGSGASGDAAGALPDSPAKPFPSPRRAEDESRLEAQYGAPERLSLSVPMHAWEYHLLRMSRRDGRFRDATILIPYDGRLVCIVKHSYPSGIARPPSGAVVPGEPADSAAAREAFEETGLRVRITRYLLAVSVEFTLGDRVVPQEVALAEASQRRDGGYGHEALSRYAAENPVPPGHVERWASHVFWAEPVGGELAPRDTEEVKSLVLVTPGELEGPIHERMRASGIGGFSYRVALQDAALRAARARRLLPDPGA